MAITKVVGAWPETIDEAVVTTTMIYDSAITTAKIADSAVTPSKLNFVPFAPFSSHGNSWDASTTSTSYVNAVACNCVIDFDVLKKVATTIKMQLFARLYPNCKAIIYNHTDGVYLSNTEIVPTHSSGYESYTSAEEDVSDYKGKNNSSFK